ncbi:hypothetical protein F443_23263, partial [Phytophthora nicotianae P1569]
LHCVSICFVEVLYLTSRALPPIQFWPHSRICGMEETAPDQDFVQVAAAVPSSQETTILGSQETESQEALPLAQASPDQACFPDDPPSPMVLPPYASPVELPSQSPPPSEPGSDYVPSEYEDHYVSSSEHLSSATMLNHRRGEGRDEGGVGTAEALDGIDSAQRHSSTSRSISMSLSGRIIAAESLDGASDPFKDEIRYTNTIWMEGVRLALYGWAVDGIDVRLFDASSLFEIDSAFLRDMDQRSDADMRRRYNFDRHMFFIDLFFRWRFFKKHGKTSKNIYPDDLTLSWKAFVDQFKRSLESWTSRYYKEKGIFINMHVIGAMMNVHEESVAHGYRCLVPQSLECPFCYDGISSLKHITNDRVPKSLIKALAILEQVRLRWPYSKRRRPSIDSN